MSTKHWQNLLLETTVCMGPAGPHEWGLQKPEEDGSDMVCLFLHDADNEEFANRMALCWNAQRGIPNDEILSLRRQLAHALAENARLLECIASARQSLDNILPSA